MESMDIIIDGDCRFCLGSTKLLRRILVSPLHVITQYDLEYTDFQNDLPLLIGRLIASN